MAALLNSLSFAFREMNTSPRSRFHYSHGQWLRIFAIKDVNIDAMIPAKDARITLSADISDRCLHVVLLLWNGLYPSINLLTWMPCQVSNKLSINSTAVRLGASSGLCCSCRRFSALSASGRCLSAASSGLCSCLRFRLLAAF